MDDRIKLVDRLKLQLQGYLYVGDEVIEGWKEPTRIYMFKCPVHGYVKSHVKGYNERLECPECIKEELKTNKINAE